MLCSPTGSCSIKGRPQGHLSRLHVSCAGEATPREPQGSGSFRCQLRTQPTAKTGVMREQRTEVAPGHT